MSYRCHTNAIWCRITDASLKFLTLHTVAPFLFVRLNAVPSFQFDPLLVESNQAATVVLMLDSPEEEVLAKACEAIYKLLKNVSSAVFNLQTIELLNNVHEYDSL